MKRILVIFIGVVFTFSSSTSALAAKTVPFKNQREGQFCKQADLKKTVTLPDETKLVCKKDGSKSRWMVYVEPVKTVPYKNQRVGQFCKNSDIKKRVNLPDGTVLVCTSDGSRARWQEEEFPE